MKLTDSLVGFLLGSLWANEDGAPHGPRSPVRRRKGARLIPVARTQGQLARAVGRRYFL